MFEGADSDPLDNFEMTEVDLMERSPFRWVDLFGNQACLAAAGFNCFALIAEVDGLSMAIVKRDKFTGAADICRHEASGHGRSR